MLASYLVVSQSFCPYLISFIHLFFSREKEVVLTLSGVSRSVQVFIKLFGFYLSLNSKLEAALPLCHMGHHRVLAVVLQGTCPG